MFNFYCSRKRFKKVLATSAIAIGLLTITACADSTDDDAAPKNPDPKIDYSAEPSAETSGSNDFSSSSSSTSSGSLSGSSSTSSNSSSSGSSNSSSNSSSSGSSNNFSSSSSNDLLVTTFSRFMGIPIDEILTDPSENSSQESQTSSIVLGKALYASKGCIGCHGERGEGPVKIQKNNWSHQALTKKIMDTMPIAAPQNCGEDCSLAIADHIATWVDTSACDTPEELLPRRMRLLTPHEYQLTINSLFRLNSRNTWARHLPRTELIRGYDNNGPKIQASFAHATQYWNTANTISQTIYLSRVINCSSLNQLQCANKLMDGFASKIFRRKLDQEERSIYTDLFMTADNNNAGVRLVLKSMLISPNFLYRSELGESDGAGGFRLTSYEIASLLSYTFWGTMPDQTLFDLAERNSLIKPSVFVAQAKRLLNDARARNQLVYFSKHWLNTLDIGRVFKAPGVFPGFNGDLSKLLQTEFELFFADAFLNGTTRFEDLFLADYVYANDRLADFYDVSGANTSTFKKVDAGPYRGGLLHLGGVLATHAKTNQTSPILRGVFVRERLMCQEFPPPPVNVGRVKPVNMNLSTRERVSAHTENEGCRGCHEKIDPIGFSFERYDGSGKYRETEGNNIFIDDAGSITGLTLMSDTDYYPYDGTQGLGAILAQSESAAACLADQFHTYFQGVEEPNSCVVDDVVSRWRAKNYTLTELWLESVKSPSFIRRR